MTLVTVILYEKEVRKMRLIAYGYKMSLIGVKVGRRLENDCLCLKKDFYLLWIMWDKVIPDSSFKM